MLGITPSLAWMAVGQVLLGIAEPLLLIVCLPEMVEVIDRKYPDLDEDERMRVYDLSSGLFNGFLGLG